MCAPLLAHLEGAKLSQKTGDTLKALTELQNELRRAGNTKVLVPLPISIIFLFFKHDIYLCLQTPNEEAKDKMLRAKAHVFVGRWLKETGQTHNNVIIDEYERSIKLCPTYVEKERPTKGRSKNIKLISGGRRDISFLPSTTIHS